MSEAFSDVLDTLSEEEISNLLSVYANGLACCQCAPEDRRIDASEIVGAERAEALAEYAYEGLGCRSPSYEEDHSHYFWLLVDALSDVGPAS